MQGLRILFLSYREWAKPVLEAVQKHPSVAKVVHISTNMEYENIARFCVSKTDLQGYNVSEHVGILPIDFYVDKSFTFDLVILCGWSNEPDEDYVKDTLHIGVHCAEHDRYSHGSPLQNQIIDGINYTKHRVFKAWYPELALREYSHEVDLDMSGNMDDILEQMTVTSKALFNRFLDDYPNITWSKWPESDEIRPRRKPEDSIVTKEQLCKMTTKQMYDFFRCLESPYPNGCIKDDEGELYIERVRWKKL